MGGWSRGCTPPKECCRLPSNYFWMTRHIKLGHSWYQWIIKSDFSGWFDNSKKGEVSGQIEWMEGWSRGCIPPKECCRLPPTYFWTTWHIKLGHSWYQWKIKSDLSRWFYNSEKGEVSGHGEWLSGWSRGWTPPKECCRLPPTYFWATWHIKIGHSWYQWIIKSDFSGWFDNSKKGEVFGHCRWMWGWSRGCTPPKECCRLPPTYF